jgi:hypothetical protein
MGYKHNSVIRFDNLADTGINEIPVESLIQIGSDLYVLENKTGITAGTTVTQAISGNNLVKSASSPEVATDISTAISGIPDGITGSLVGSTLTLTLP